MNDLRIRIASLLAATLACSPLACDRTPAPPAEPAPSKASAQKKDAHDHDHDHDHDHGHEHGATVQLGEVREGDYVIKASRDGEIKAADDAPVDVWVSGGTARIIAVRFWVGTADGKGSIKAKAEIEGDHWHTHVEMPDTVAPDARLWVEIEAEGGGKTVASFDLRQ